MFALLRQLFQAMLARVFFFGDSSDPRRRRVIGVIVAASVLAGAGVLSWVEGRSAPDKGVGYICMGPVSGTPEEEAAARALCDRQARDEASRTTLPIDAARDPAVAEIWRTLQEAVCRPDGGDFICMSMAGRPATEADAEMVRKVLRGQGRPEAIVRTARPDDPAPVGAIVVAVPLRAGVCLVGYVEMGRGVMASPVSGLRPDGRCLAE
ncbi:hypothetical protein M1L60_36025 [Actinoplanes sp. TRM 88003]|uniref:Uncharacterized protein n=1 Tax=Paractinoplanes aksuensis TaxID=2939490 RepID=A0ABT1DZ20_9ACTN|nr:hypothetical protein [Actinoplanes aksuensis]MCO8276000.1 hypothetical protein [Actinoplanes aksuensis]